MPKDSSSQSDHTSLLPDLSQTESPASHSVSPSVLSCVCRHTPLCVISFDNLTTHPTTPVPQGSEAPDAPHNPLLNSIDVDMEGIDCTAILIEDEPAHIYYFNGQVNRVKSDLENAATSVHNITEALNLFMPNNYCLDSGASHHLVNELIQVVYNVSKNGLVEHTFRDAPADSPVQAAIFFFFFFFFFHHFITRPYRIHVSRTYGRANK
jgi:hypothetical protein